ncbi:MAG: nucleoside triphosphate pyrophosphohydrolase [Salinivirgaceae bacterium]|nr:nucleoside triphosphate pyrophosphohydrolase [Salinivirgaceae bacterium]
MARKEQLEAFGQLLDIMDELREKCPWDKKQTFESLRVQTIEESYELTEAIIANDMDEVKKELGDLLLHIVFYAKMGSEQGKFDIADVINSLCQKLIYRHPHVFGDEKANSAEAVLQNWEQLKLKEKGRKPSVLSGVPKSLPALVKAYRIQDKTHSIGFDWQEREQVWQKVEEELSEFKIELQSDPSSKATESEFGDLLFSLVNAGRLYKINPENALESTNLKFIGRFNYIEEQIKKNGGTLKDTPIEEMDRLWNEAKSIVG